MIQAWRKTFTLLPHHAQDEDAAIDALGEYQGDWPNTFIISLMGHLDTPEPFKSERFLRLVEVCRNQGWVIMLSRWLWPGWHPIPPQALTDPAYYAAFLTALEMERDRLDARYSMVDSEGGGNECTMEHMRRLGSNVSQETAVVSAIQQAMLYAPKADFVYPYGDPVNRYKESYGWLPLGRRPPCTTTMSYYACAANGYKGWNFIRAGWHIGLWGTAVGQAPTADGTPMTIADVKDTALHFDDVKKNNPLAARAEGVFVYVNETDMPFDQMVKKWDES